MSSNSSTVDAASASAAAPATRVSIVEVAEENESQTAAAVAARLDAISLGQSDDAAAAPASSGVGASDGVAASAAASASAVPSSDLSAPFQLVSDARFAKDANAAMRRYYHKWNIDNTCHMARWRYLQSADLNDPASLHALIVSLTNSPAFRSNFRCYSSARRSMEPIPATATVTRATLAPVRATLTDLHLFDRLWTEQPPIVFGSLDAPLADLPPNPASSGSSAAAVAAAVVGAEELESTDGNGAIRKCFDDEVDGVAVADELRRALLDRDSDAFEIFSPSDRSELLFQLFTHLCVGGGLCQYENNVQAYLACTKLLYRDLLAVRTNRNTDALEVASIVLRLRGLTVADLAVAAGAEKPFELFGSNDKDKHHLCFLSIDPHKRHITLYYFAHTPAW